MKFLVKNNYFIILAILIVSLAFKTIESANCTSAIGDIISYLITPDPGYNRQVNFLMNSINTPAKYVSYSSGKFQVGYTKQLGPLKTNKIESMLFAKNVKQLFSDRAWCPDSPGGDYLCFNDQPFDYRHADTIQLYLYKDSTSKIFLTTWGNTSLSFPLECKDGFVHGTLKGKNNEATYFSVAFQKKRTTIIT